MTAASAKRIHGFSSCVIGLLVQAKHEPLLSAMIKTRFVLGSFSAWYILERSRHKRDTRRVVDTRAGVPERWRYNFTETCFQEIE